MTFFGAEIVDCKYHRMMEDNARFYYNYLIWQFQWVMQKYGAEQLRYLPFFFHLVAVIDHEDMLSMTGNLDADL